MNSDPHESAAWRTFGMLDADKAAAFDEAMRHDPELRSAYQEMDRLAAAVAVTATVPIAPRAGQLERLHLRLGLTTAKRANWLGITGWAAAAALTLVLVLDRTRERPNPTAGRPDIQPAHQQQQSTAIPPEPDMTTEPERILTIQPERLVDRPPPCPPARWRCQGDRESGNQAADPGNRSAPRTTGERLGAGSRAV